MESRSGISQHLARPSLTGEKLCWICYVSDSEEVANPQAWLRPCRCCGSAKWVHQSCLQLWIDEKQKGDCDAPVNCHACGYQYVVIYPPPGLFITTMNTISSVLDVACTYFFGAALVGCLYWSAVTYGAVTIMQIYGHSSGLTAMEETDPVFLLLGLPAIPIFLILARMVRWQDYVISIWRRYIIRLPLIRKLIPKDIPVSRLIESNERSYFDLGSVPRLFCSALALPTFSTLCGRLFFSHIHSKLLQTLVGGVFYTGVTGMFGIYHRELKFLRSCRRKVMDFVPE